MRMLAPQGTAAVLRAFGVPIGFAGGRGFRRPMNSAWAFTLIEVMIVVALIGLALTTSLPGFLRARRHEGMRAAVEDVKEACHRARAHAILKNSPTELFIPFETADSYSLHVRLVHVPPRQMGEAIFPETVTPADDASSGNEVFSVRLPEAVAIEMLDVNNIDQMTNEECRVRFYPNGTSDEFNIVLLANQQRTRIFVDSVTGLAEVDAGRFQ